MPCSSFGSRFSGRSGHAATWRRLRASRELEPYRSLVFVHVLSILTPALADDVQAVLTKHAHPSPPHFLVMTTKMTATTSRFGLLNGFSQRPPIRLSEAR